MDLRPQSGYNSRMRTRLTNLLIIAVCLAPAAAGAAQVPADPDMKELAAYRLTMETVNKVAAATRTMVAEVKKDPRFQEALKLDAEIKALEAWDGQGCLVGNMAPQPPGRVLNESDVTVHGIRIEMKNMDYSDNAVYSDMPDYYQYVSPADGDRVELTPIVEDDGAGGGSVNQIEFCHPIVVDDPPV